MNKKRKIQLVTILSAIVLSVLVYVFNPLLYFSQEFGKLDSELKHLVITVVVASLAGSLFAFRNKAKGELFEQFEALELLLLIVIPSVEGFLYIMQNPMNYGWAISVYVIGVMGWFVLVITRHKPIADSKKEKKFTIKISYILAILLSLHFLYFGSPIHSFINTTIALTLQGKKNHFNIKFLKGYGHSISVKDSKSILK